MYLLSRYDPDERSFEQVGEARQFAGVQLDALERSAEDTSVYMVTRAQHNLCVFYMDGAALSPQEMVTFLLVQGQL